MAQSDVDRIRELTKRLEELCREGEFIREKIENIARQMPIYPEPSASACGGNKPFASEFTSSRRSDDQN
jgi:hypothetical protein